ncbi:ABC transporter permease [Flavobacteriaceae bacterium]|nr:ABC transporter permease [Flavobacteriaceae bacterium]MDB4049990.1 ABC transporter permease [Flavobacteriaceae bacterium]MDB4086274.1 ABC transporter permease [Flavobacteriaceae bacterium]MDB4240416.1 ABC transporter permease [Flavobacteriaceae bacterium]MDB9788082.1 ABC transporter permease [Flavobacteriaceae bacterium]
MNIFKLSIKNIFNKPLSSFISLALLILGIGIISLLLQLNTLIKDQMDNNLRGIDMVVGAKGSPLQLILSSVYHIDSPTGNISLKDAENISKNRMVGSSIKILYGDNHKGFRIVGAEKKFIELYKGVIKEGKEWNSPYEVLVGSKVYEKLNINLGDNLVSSHGLRETGQSHDEGTFKVVGLLEPSNSVIDQLIITSPESVWDIHDTHNHEDDHEHEHEDEDDHENEYDDREITAMLIKFKSPMNIIQFPRQINENTNLQAAVPSYEISRLFKLFGFGIETLSYLAYLIILVSGFSLFINLFNSMRERKYEMALIRTLGASRFQLSSMITLESLVLTISGFVLGILFSRFGVMFVSSLMEESINYNFSSFRILNEEYWLLGLSILIGIISSLIPAIQVYKMNISKILADA